MKPVFLLVVKRLGLGLLTLFVISGLIFVGVEALPGDLAEAILGQGATPEAVEAFRKELKLDLPPLTRYVSWLGAVVQGDLGKSLSSETDIAELIGWRLKKHFTACISGGVHRDAHRHITGIVVRAVPQQLF
jgi:peptide/nickel transport system permease protein